MRGRRSGPRRTDGLVFCRWPARRGEGDGDPRRCRGRRGVERDGAGAVEQRRCLHWAWGWWCAGCCHGQASIGTGHSAGVRPSGERVDQRRSAARERSVRLCGTGPADRAGAGSPSGRVSFQRSIAGARTPSPAWRATPAPAAARRRRPPGGPPSGRRGGPARAVREDQHVAGRRSGNRRPSCPARRRHVLVRRLGRPARRPATDSQPGGAVPGSPRSQALVVRRSATPAASFPFFAPAKARSRHVSARAHQRAGDAPPRRAGRSRELPRAGPPSSARSCAPRTVSGMSVRRRAGRTGPFRPAPCRTRRMRADMRGGLSSGCGKPPSPLRPARSAEQPPRSPSRPNSNWPVPRCALQVVGGQSDQRRTVAASSAAILARPARACPRHVPARRDVRQRGSPRGTASEAMCACAAVAE